MASLDCRAYRVRHCPGFAQVFSASARVYGRALLVLTNINMLLRKDENVLRIIESQTHLGWKRPLRSSSPTVSLTLLGLFPERASVV